MDNLYEKTAKNQVTPPEKVATIKNLIISRRVWLDWRALKANILVKMKPAINETK